MMELIPYIVAAVLSIGGSFMGLTLWVGKRFIDRVDCMGETVTEMGRELSRLTGILEGRQ